MTKEQLLARAQELKIEVPEGATNEAISNLIKIAEHPTLKKDLSKAQSDLADANKEIESLEGQLSEANTNLASANAEKEELEGQLNKSSEAEKSQDLITYKNSKGTYAFTVREFRAQGRKWTAEEAVENKDLMESLIKAGFSNLKKQ